MPRKLDYKEYNARCIRRGLNIPIIPYKNARTKIKVICKDCGKPYYKTPRDYLNSIGYCRDCSIKHSRKTADEFLQECKNNNLDLPVDPYKGCFTKIRFRCKKCGELYSQQPSAHLKGQGHYKCNGGHKKTSKAYLDECRKKHLDLPIESYKGENTEIHHHCIICGKNYLITPKMHLRGVQHRVHFSFSTGEKLIYRWLLEHNYTFEYQKRFDNLKATHSIYLSFDFFIPSKRILIEYQGQQHFTPMAFKKGKEKFERQVKNDKRKKLYAKAEGYTLLTPDYHIDTYEKIDAYMKNNVETLK